MNRIVVPLLLFSFVIFFFFGLFVGIYKFFPYHELDELKTQLEPKNIKLDNKTHDTLNLSDMISIQDKNDIIQKRYQLTQFIWNSDEIPKKLPDIVENNFYDERFDDLSNLKHIDKLIIEMEYGVSSTVYMFVPETNNGKLILYHQGHSGGFINGKYIIQKFLNNGFSVAAFSMPLLGLNNQPIVEIEKIGPVKFFKHDQLIYLENNNFSSMSYFFTPLAATLNHIDKNYSFDEYTMVGISGGGWASTVYPALDTRISKSFAVAGSLPLSLRNTSNDVGDYEQYRLDFYSIANYFELYLMSAYGETREFIQIFNKYDPCCFAGNISISYADSIKDRLSELGTGNFEVIIDDTHHEHKISDTVIELILNN